MKYPFVHEELAVKQNFLNIAREFAVSKDTEKQLAAALAYANLADYLGTHLYESLKLAAQNATRTFFNGVIVLNMKDESALPMGKVIQGLEAFVFPSKELIIPLMKRIKKNRDMIMHGLLKVPVEELRDVDRVLESLGEDVELLVTYVDDIYRSLPPRTILDSLPADDKVDDPNRESGNAPSKDKKAKGSGKKQP